MPQGKQVVGGDSAHLHCGETDYLNKFLDSWVRFHLKEGIHRANRHTLQTLTFKAYVLFSASLPSFCLKVSV